jgi:hypothetical protein
MAPLKPSNANLATDYYIRCGVKALNQFFGSGTFSGKATIRGVGSNVDVKFAIMTKYNLSKFRLVLRKGN